MDLPDNLIFHQFPLGPMDNFLYFIGDKDTKEIAVVDPAWDVDFLCNEAEKNGYKIAKVFLTHAHHDHVNGLEELLARFDVPAYISKHEFHMYMPEHKNMVHVEDGDELTIGSINLKTMLAPGHSPGCHLMVHKNVCIAGDVIFVDGCGRCDLPGSDVKAMYNSLYNVLLSLPDDTQVFCGHNYGSTSYATIADLKKNNPYLTCTSEEEFLSQRMGMF